MNRLSSLRKGLFSSELIIILIGLIIGFSILLGFEKITLGMLGFAGIFLCSRKVENLFLFWLLTFSLFSIDTISFLKIGTHPILNYDRIFVLILLCIFLKELALKERKLVPINGMEIIFLFLFLFIVYSILDKTINKLTGIRYLVDAFLLPFIIYFLSKNFISERKDFIKFVNIFLIVGMYLSLMGIYEYFSGQDLFPDTVYGGLRITENRWLRVNGPYQRDYTLGIGCLICFFITLYKYMITDKRKRLLNIFHVCILLVTIVAIYATFYRGVWLAGLTGLITWFLIRRKGFIKLNIFIIVLVLFIIPFVDDFRSSEFYGSRIADAKNVEFRFRRYDTSLSLFRESPILGIGFRNFTARTGTVSQHNQILAMLSETGLIGVSLYISLLFMLAYYGIKNYKLSHSYLEREFVIIFLCLLVVYIVLGLGLNSGFDNKVNLLFFTIAGVALNIAKLSKYKNKAGSFNL